jgi:tetratricopeptide (TPR) repeat protein
VRRAGNRVRIVARLIRTSDQTTLLDQGYDGELRDVLVLQSDVARAVAREVEIKLTPRQQAQLGSRPVNPEAYEAYLKGHYFLSKFTGDAEQKALEYFQQAIEKDPTYARAYAGMCTAYALLTNFGVLTPKDGIPKAKSAAAKAIEIDIAQNEAYSQLGWIKMLYDWDFPEAEKEFQHAIELDPNFASTHEGYSMLLAALGRFDESLTEMKRARDLDPLSLIINTDFCTVLYYARRYDQAIAQCKAALELDPNFVLALWRFGSVYAAKGMYPEAAAIFMKANALDGTSQEEIAAALPGPRTFVLSELGYAYARSGRTAEARRILQTLEGQARSPHHPGLDLARIYLGLGEHDQALAWLEAGYNQHSMYMIWLKVEPTLQPLHSDPRFANLVRRVGLPQ